jgi:hypothetical protein
MCATLKSNPPLQKVAVAVVVTVGMQETLELYQRAELVLELLWTGFPDQTKQQQSSPMKTTAIKPWNKLHSNKSRCCCWNARNFYAELDSCINLPLCINVCVYRNFYAELESCINPPLCINVPSQPIGRDLLFRSRQHLLIPLLSCNGEYFPIKNTGVAV